MGRRNLTLDKVRYKPARNVDTEIGGRKYTGHSVDRMQERGILPSVVENTIAEGIPLPDPEFHADRTLFYDPVNDVSVITKGDLVMTAMYPDFEGRAWISWTLGFTQ